MDKATLPTWQMGIACNLLHLQFGYMNNVSTCLLDMQCALRINVLHATASCNMPDASSRLAHHSPRSNLNAVPAAVMVVGSAQMLSDV